MLRILFCLIWNLSMGQLDLEEPRLRREEERAGKGGDQTPGAPISLQADYAYRWKTWDF